MGRLGGWGVSADGASRWMGRLCRIGASWRVGRLEGWGFLEAGASLRMGRLCRDGVPRYVWTPAGLEVAESLDVVDVNYNVLPQMVRWQMSQDCKGV